MARAAATMTAVVPTLLLMSHVSSWVRSELMAVLLGWIRSGGGLAETRPQQCAADRLVGQVVGYRTAQSGHLVAVAHAVHVPAVVGQPCGGVRTVGLVVGQRLDVDVQPEPVAHPQPALRVAP